MASLGHMVKGIMTMRFVVRGMASLGKRRGIDQGLPPGRTLYPRVDRAFEPVDRSWHLINGEGHVLGRMASKIVRLLCGKHKPIYQPQRDVGDYGAQPCIAHCITPPPPPPLNDATCSHHKLPAPSLSQWW